MELRHLRYFVALAEHLSFTRAARQTHITQSTLSHQIRQLEDEVGQRLFDRVGKRVFLTEAGQNLLPRILRALGELDEGLRALSPQDQVLTGLLRIAATHTFNVNLVPACLTEFLTRNPSMRVVVEELAASVIEERLLAGALDLGISYRPERQQDLAFEPLYDEPLDLVLSPDHRWATRKWVRMAELHHQPVVLLSPEFTTRRLLDECFRQCGAVPHLVAEMNTIGPILGLVRRMNIVAILSRQALPEDGTLLSVPLETPTPMRSPGVLLRRNEVLPPHVASFLHTLRRACDGTSSPPRRL